MEQKGSNWIRFLPLLVVALGIVLVLLWMNREPGSGGDGSSAETAQGLEGVSGDTDAGPSMTDREQAWDAATGSPPEWPRDLESPLDCGQAVAELRDVWGRPLGEGLLHSEHDGFVMGRSHGIYFYPGNAVLGMAIRDDAPLVAPYPDDFFKD